MKKGFVSFFVFLLIFGFVSCGEDKSIEGNDEDSSVTDDNNDKEEEVADLESHDDKEIPEEDVDDTIVDSDNTEEINDAEDTEIDEDILDDDLEEPDGVVGQEPDYSCNSQPCSVDEDCDCDASWCVIDDDNVSYAGLTKQTCAKADCVVGDDSTCPSDYTCVKIPGFVIALMPELPETVCKAE